MKSPGIVAEAVKRGISTRLLDEYMPEVLVEDTETKSKFNAFAMPNDLDGVELCAYYPKKESPFDKFKNCVGPKAITSYPAEASQKEITVLAYSSKWDFLTWISLKGHQPHEEMIVYHGDGLVNTCAEHILENPLIKTVLHFKHNDESGIKADAALALKLEAAPIQYGSVEHLYSGYKDLSDCFIDQPQELRAALKIDSVHKVFYEPVIKPQGTPKYGL